LLPPRKRLAAGRSATCRRSSPSTRHADATRRRDRSTDPRRPKSAGQLGIAHNNPALPLDIAIRILGGEARTGRSACCGPTAA
jgi:hypothetical protein